jgi:DNA ligase
MDLGHSRNRDLEQNQPQQQEMSHEQRVGQLYNDIDAQSRKNSEVAQVFNRYSGPEQLELKNQIAHAAASATRSPDPHITGMFVSNDNRHIAGWVNEHFMFKVPFPEHSRKEEQPQPIQQRVEKVEIGSRKYEMTVTIASTEAIAPSTGETGSHPATPSGITQEKNPIGKSGDWLEENLTSPVRNGYEEYVKRPLADALKIEADDSEITRTFKQGATAVGGAALGVAESVGEGITGAGNLAKEGASLAYDKASLFAYEHLDIDIGIGSEDDARMAKERSDAQLKTLSRVWEHTKDSAQEYINNPAKLKTDLSDGLDSMKAGAERWAEAVGNADLNRTVEEGKPLTDAATLLVGGAGLVKGGMALRRKALHAAEETAARAKAEFYRETLQDIGDWGKDKNLSPDSFAYKNLAESLARENMPFEDFKALTRTHMDDMTQEQIGQMKRIRDDVPMIDRHTVVTKVMPYEYLEGYLRTDNPYNTIGGFVTRKDDYGHLVGEKLSETYKHLALDYPNSAYTKALEEGKDRYLVFEGKLTKPNQTEIPYGRKFGGNHETPPPCTLNGFIACRSDEILPEFEVKTAHNAPQFPEHGSILWVIENGVKRKAAIFDDEKMRFMPNDISKNK